MRSLTIRIIAVLIQVILLTVALRLASRAIGEAAEEYQQRRRRAMVELLSCLELPFPIATPQEET